MILSWFLNGKAGNQMFDSSGILLEVHNAGPENLELKLQPEKILNTYAFGKTSISVPKIPINFWVR